MDQLISYNIKLVIAPLQCDCVTSYKRLTLSAMSFSSKSTLCVSRLASCEEAAHFYHQERGCAWHCPLPHRLSHGLLKRFHHQLPGMGRHVQIRHNVLYYMYTHPAGLLPKQLTYFMECELHLWSILPFWGTCMYITSVPCIQNYSIFVYVWTTKLKQSFWVCICAYDYCAHCSSSWSFTWPTAMLKVEWWLTSSLSFYTTSKTPLASSLTLLLCFPTSWLVLPSRTYKSVQLPHFTLGYHMFAE